MSFIQKLKCEYLFILAYVFLGLYMLISVLPMRVPDEREHFFRSYEISQLHLISETSADGLSSGCRIFEGNLQPLSVERSARLDDVKEALDIHLDDKNPQKYCFRNQALYAPTNFLPQALGIALSRIFTDRAVALMYAGKFFNFAFLGLMLFFSIRLLPRYKLLYSVILLLPINLQQFVSISADGMSMASVALLVSFVFYLRYHSIKIGAAVYAVLIVLCTFVALSKIVYFPMILVVCLLGRFNFKSTKEYVAGIVSCIAIPLLINFVWFLISFKILQNSEQRPGVIPELQKNYVITHPFEVLGIYIYSLSVDFHTYLDSIFGRYLGVLDVVVDKPIIKRLRNLLLIVFVIEIICESGDCFLRYYHKLILLCLSLMVVGLMCSALYVQWTPYKATAVEGIQGRYFLPVVFVFLVALMPNFGFIIRLFTGRKSSSSHSTSYESSAHNSIQWYNLDDESQDPTANQGILYTIICVVVLGYMTSLDLKAIGILYSVVS